jgi:carboxyl-terminal processing protease
MFVLTWALSILLAFSDPAPRPARAQAMQSDRGFGGNGMSASVTQPLIFDRALARIEQDYVDPTRLHARRMLVAALDEVQREIPEVMVEAQVGKQEVAVQVQEKTQLFTLADVDSTPLFRVRMNEILDFIRSNASLESDPARIEYAAVNGMLSTLDPHSLLLDPLAAHEMDVNISGEFGGLGLVIGMGKDTTGDESVIIRSLVAGDTPARRAGLAVGDRIVKINDESTARFTIDDATRRLRGRPGTDVTILVARSGIARATSYVLTRRVIEVPPVSRRLLERHVGYLKIDHFSRNVSSDLQQAMEDLRMRGARSWLLDLRGNTGGLLGEAVLAADLFLDSGTIVTTVSSRGTEREENRAHADATDDRSPLLVLVNGTTASAAEIFSGALRYLDRALIVGTTTYGKGSVQVLYDNPDSSKLKLTVAQYLVANDLSIQSVGVTPDIEIDRLLVPAQLKSDRDTLRLIPPSGIHESDLEAYLTSDREVSGGKPSFVIDYLADPAPIGAGPAPPDDEEAFRQDFEIAFGRDLLASSKARTRPGLLHDAEKLVRARLREGDARVTGALGKLNIDWKAGSGHVGGRLSASFSTDKPGNAIVAGDTVAITGIVTNTGTAPTYRVLARARSGVGALEDVELAFGRIAPGATKRATAYVRVPKDMESRVEEVSWTFTEEPGVEVESPPLGLRITGRPLPQDPPAVALEIQGEPLETAGDQWLLKGSARDEHGVEDLYVLVSNDSAKIDGKKVFYASNHGKEAQSRLDFTANIPLWPGSNRITIAARENKDVQTNQSVWIYRSAGEPSADAPSRR